MTKLPGMFEQLMSAAASADAARAEAARPPWPLNPFPKGIRPGSATDRVLAELRRVAPQPLEAGQLRFRCQAGRGAVAWATAYLIAHGLVQQLHDSRSPQYHRYQAIPHDPAKP